MIGLLPEIAIQSGTLTTTSPLRHPRSDTNVLENIVAPPCKPGRPVQDLLVLDLDQQGVSSCQSREAGIGGWRGHSRPEQESFWVGKGGQMCGLCLGVSRLPQPG